MERERHAQRCGAFKLITWRCGFRALRGVASLQPDKRSVTLKDGLDLHQLRTGEGATFEVDPTAPNAEGSLAEEKEEEGFKDEEILQQLNFGCIDAGGDSDSEEVRLAAALLELVASYYNHRLNSGKGLEKGLMIAGSVIMNVRNAIFLQAF